MVEAESRAADLAEIPMKNLAANEKIMQPANRPDREAGDFLRITGCL
jgi:hypothetical protein